MLQSWHGGVGWSWRWKRKEGRSYHDTTPLLCHYVLEWCVASPQWWRQHEVVGVEVGEVCRALGCWRWNSLTTARAWTSVWGSHMLSKFDQPTNLTRYHSLPHLNLEFRISLTSYSSWSLTVIGPGHGGCGHSEISSGMYSISPPNEHTILVPVPTACTSIKFTQSVWNFH